MKIVYLGLGSNLGDPVKNIEEAIAKIRAMPKTRLVARSSLYRTAPFCIDSDNWFINAVVGIETSLGPRDVLEAGLALEASFGRTRAKGPDRELDVDILYFSDCIIWERDLKIPHPNLAQRRFVLIPWVEIAGNFVVRPWGRTISELLSLVQTSDEVVLVT